VLNREDNGSNNRLNNRMEKNEMGKKSVDIQFDYPQKPVVERGKNERNISVTCMLLKLERNDRTIFVNRIPLKLRANKKSWKWLNDSLTSFRTSFSK
jgi:hypothetical protein